MAPTGANNFSFMYKYKVGGKKGQEFTLVESKDLVVVRTNESKDLKELTVSRNTRDLLPKMQQVSAFPEANVAVYKCIDPQARNIKTVRDEIRSALKSEEEVRFAGRVLVDKDSGAIFIYTENFFIKFHDEVSETRCKEIIDLLGMTIKDQLKFAQNAYFTTVPEGTGLEIFELSTKLLEEYPEVEYSHPELIREKKNKSTIHPLQWHLHPTSINGVDIDQGVEIPAAWKKTKGKGVTIAVIDDGFDIDHEEFQGEGKVVAPRDTLAGTDDPRPKFAFENHGTACAGVACASGRHKAAGTAPEASLMPIRFGGLGSISEANAFAWAADNGADVVSCSWGPADGEWFNPNDPAHNTSVGLFDSTRLAIDYAVRNGRGGKGCVIAWAAGNGNENVFFDGYASYENVITIAATNDRGKRAVYSDFGEAVWCSFPSNDFEAPLFNNPRPLSPGIWTTDRQGRNGYNPGGYPNAETIIGDEAGNYTATFGGTSSACPGAAGIMALILSINPDLNWNQVREILKNSCDRVDEENGMYKENGHSIFYGYGRLNARKAVENAEKTLSREESFTIRGLLLFKDKGRIIFEKGLFDHADNPTDRLIGLELVIQPFHPDLHISYSLVLNRMGIIGPGRDKAFVGTEDRRRKAIGFSACLEGKLADEYMLEYTVQFDDPAHDRETSRDGGFCGEQQGRGDAIVGISLEIKKRE
jgi:subtilisin family serine protease